MSAKIIFGKDVQCIKDRKTNVRLAGSLAQRGHVWPEVQPDEGGELLWE